MHYVSAASAALKRVAEELRALDGLTDACSTHRLDHFEPLAHRLARMAEDLESGRMVAALRKSNELMMRLLGGTGGLDDPKYRSALAAILGSYQRNGPPKANLGGLRGGRPRKDGKPVRTLERKGYSAENLPLRKGKNLREHPPLKQSIRSRSGG